MGFQIRITQNDLSRIAHNISTIPGKSNTMLAIHELLRNRCSPYVPFKTGILDSTTFATPEYVEYGQIYAHYMYQGEVYGPNFPIYDSSGQIIGWRSPALGPGSKYPTNRPIHYDTSNHPLATDHWDRAMLNDHRDEFTKEVAQIIQEAMNG